MEELKTSNLLEISEDFVPQSGDLIFFEGSGEDKDVYVGIVLKSDPSNNTLIVIEGDRDNQVAEAHYSLDEEGILGYLDLNGDGASPSQTLNGAWVDSADGRVNLKAWTTTGVQVLIRGPETSFPKPLDALELRVIELTQEATDQDYLNQLQAILEEGLDDLELTPARTRLFDIDLLLDGQQAQVPGPVEVLFLGSGLEGQVQVYHIDESEEIITDQGAEQTEDGGILFETDHFSTFAILMDDSLGMSPLAGLPVNDYGAIDHGPLGIKINLFDYWSTEQYARTASSTGGINQGKNLKFFYDDGDLTGYNKWTGDAIRYADILQRNMGSDGYPVINPNVGGIDSQSSKYLFAPDRLMTHNGKVSYEDVNYLFKEEAGYYLFDSEKDYAYYDPGQNDGGSFEITKTYLHNDKEHAIGFFPFDAKDPSHNVTSGTQNTFNHFFGLTMEANFQLPPGMQVDGQDMIFEFRGDDDAWVFIDNVLVLDIGGVHDAMIGSINFKTGVVTVQEGSDNFITTTIGYQFALAGKDWNGAEYSEHKINFYFLERGANLSNLMMKFNVPTFSNEDLAIQKEVTDVGGTLASPNTLFDFILLVEGDEGSEFVPYVGAATIGNTAIQISDGTFQLKAGEKAVIPELPLHHRYIIQEINLDPAIIAKVNVNGANLSPGEAEPGAGYSVTTAPTTVAEQRLVTFHNITTSSLTPLKVKKEWTDGQAMHSNDSVSFYIEDDLGNRVFYDGSATFTLDSENNWERDFDLPALELPAKEYRVVESPVPSGYRVTYPDPQVSGGASVHVIHNSPLAGLGTVAIEKEWYQKDGDGNPLSVVPDSTVEVKLWKRVCQEIVTEHTVSFQIQNTDDIGGFTTFKTVTVPHDGWIEFATGMYSSNKPIQVLRGSTPVSPTTGTVNLPCQGTVNVAKIYRLENITEDTIVTVDYGYKMIPSTIMNQSLWHSSTGGGQTGGTGGCQVVDPGLPNLVLDKGNAWTASWTDLEHGDNIEYFVEEISIDGVPMAQNTLYEVSYKDLAGNSVGSNKGIPFGNIKVKNTAPIILVEKKWYRHDGTEYAEAPAGEVELELWRKGPPEETRTYTVTFRDRAGANGSYSTYGILPNIKHGSMLRFAGLFRLNAVTYFTPNSVSYGPSSTEMFSTSVYQYPNGSGSSWSAPMYEVEVLDNITIDLTYSRYRSGTRYPWNEDIPPSYTQVNEKVDPQPNLILSAENNWMLALPALDDDYTYYVKEVRIDGENIEDTYFAYADENNEGINSGLITVKNTNQMAFGDFELPETGGRGSHKYWISGLLLITAAFTYGFKRNRWERRTNI